MLLDHQNNYVHRKNDFAEVSKNLVRPVIFILHRFCWEI